MTPTSRPEDFARTELLLTQITERLNDVCAPDDATTPDTLQRLIIVYDLFKQMLLDDPQASAGQRYPFNGMSPATLALEAVLTATAAVQDCAKRYTIAAPELDTLLTMFFETLRQDFGSHEN